MNPIDANLPPKPRPEKYGFHPRTGLHKWESDCLNPPPGEPVCTAVYLAAEVDAAAGPAPLASKNRSLQVALGLLGDAMNHGPSEPVFALIAEARDTIESALRDETTARQTKTSAWHAALLAEIEAQKALIERMDNPRNHEMRDNGIMTVLRAERLDLLEKLREFEPAFSEKSGGNPT